MDHYRSRRNCAALNEVCWKVNSSATKKVHSPVPSIAKSVALNKPTAVHCFWTKLEKMSPSIQAKFLRVLEGYAFERIGGRKPIQVNVRIVAATNRD